MATGDVETYHDGKSWKNKIEGEESALGEHDMKDEAVAAGRMLADDLGVEHIIKKLDGTISEKHSHGNDPRDVPG